MICQRRSCGCPARPTFRAGRSAISSTHLFYLYKEADRRPLRKISGTAGRLDLRGTASTETIRRMLHGTTVPPSWDIATRVFGDAPAGRGHCAACFTTRRTDRTHPSAPTPAAVAASPRWNCGDPTPSAENNLQARCHQPRRHSCPARISRPSWPQSASPFLRTRLSQDGNTGSNPVEGTGVAAGHGPDRRLRRSGPYIL